MTVREMQARMDSREFSEWIAYERAYGPLGDQWRDEIRASTHELLQQLNHLTGQAHFTDKHHRKGPAPKPEHYPRPEEAFLKANPDKKRAPDDEDEDEWVVPPSSDEDGEE